MKSMNLHFEKVLDFLESQSRSHDQLLLPSTVSS